MKLLILGSSGLLGNTITKYFLGNSNYITFGTLRDSSKISYFKEIYFNKFIILSDVLNLNDLEEKIKIIHPDVIINCIGITNKNNEKDLLEKYIKINSLFPHKLYEICLRFNVRLIQLSSDCVFSGHKGFYTEKDIPDPLDIYGRSKVLGEINYKNSITIRKSVIGHELSSNCGLLEWFLNQTKKVDGFKKAIFSGLTALELAKIIDLYVIPKDELNGVFHISGQSISKYELLKIIADVYKKNIDIIPNESFMIDRSLDASNFNELTGYESQKWYSLIKAMHEFHLLGK